VPNQIDYDFISKREGGSLTYGYVPAAAVSKSGVTIATGFDLGQRSAADLRNLGLPTELIEKLTPYMGKIAQEATDALKAKSLSVSPEEATAIDMAVRQDDVNKLQQRYLAAADNAAKIDFFAIPAQAQTVIASVCFQYGDLAARTPKFWKAVSSQDWRQGVNVLRDFGDAYPTRRKLEADLLEKVAP
jgi:hypothetical protein